MVFSTSDRQLSIHSSASYLCYWNQGVAKCRGQSTVVVSIQLCLPSTHTHTTHTHTHMYTHTHTHTCSHTHTCTHTCTHTHTFTHTHMHTYTHTCTHTYTHAHTHTHTCKVRGECVQQLHCQASYIPVHMLQPKLVTFNCRTQLQILFSYKKVSLLKSEFKGKICKIFAKSNWPVVSQARVGVIYETSQLLYELTYSKI